MTRCHICERAREYENGLGELERDEYEVAMGNGIYVPACLSCFLKWPREHARDLNRLDVELRRETA
jgi:hypothetical protein